MKGSGKAASWVVYRAVVHGQPGGASAVCEQREWDEMERHRPGHHTLVRAGIANEAEAEALARESSGYLPPAARAKARKVAGPATPPGGGN